MADRTEELVYPSREEWDIVEVDIVELNAMYTNPRYQEVQKCREKLAYYINDRRPDLCWVTLYLWSYRPDITPTVEEFADMLNDRDSLRICVQDGDPTCYCGKVDGDGGLIPDSEETA